MQMIIDYARAEGLKTIEGQVLTENTQMLTMNRELGFKIAPDPHDSDIRIVTLPIAG
jgi:acetyltransferase